MSIPTSAPAQPVRLHHTQALKFEEFRQLAVDESLSPHERVGFPNSYRDGREEAIFQDILNKTPALRESGRTVLDIGSGCSGLPRMLMDVCQQQGHRLVMVDCEEMLSQLPDRPNVEKVPAMFPDCPELMTELAQKVDVLLCYAVISCVMADMSVFRFLDAALSLLAPGGQFLIGDIPNVSKRKRFFASENGVRFHQEFTQSDEVPSVRFNCLERYAIDDAVVFGLAQRARLAGFDAYILPQPSRLPMANRREDMLIVRP